MADTFTPGPWRQEDGTRVVCGDALVAATNTLANGRLIAHAPEAHALLKELVMPWSALCSTNQWNADEYLKRVRAYLAAVEGRNA